MLTPSGYDFGSMRVVLTDARRRGAAFDTRIGAEHIRGSHNTRCLVPKPGVTQELRARVGAHLAEEVRRRQLTVVALVVAIVAVCAYFVVRWLLR